MSRVVQEVKIQLPAELQPEAEKPSEAVTIQVTPPVEVQSKVEEEKITKQEVAKAKAEDAAEFQSNLTIDEMAEILKVLLYPFKVSGITIYLKPRTQTPIVEGE